jgi:hypothetical protein
MVEGAAVVGVTCVVDGAAVEVVVGSRIMVETVASSPTQAASRTTPTTRLRVFTADGANGRAFLGITCRL